MTDDGKITIRLHPDQKAELKKRIPWGMQDAIMRRMVDALIAAHEEEGDGLLNDIEAGTVTIEFRGQRRNAHRT
jgi:hypothetical protein